MKVILVVLFLVVLAGGAGYYYFFIFEPQNYVKAVLEVKKELDEGGKVLTKSDIDGKYDYEGAIDILDARNKFLKDARDKFSQIALPYISEEFKGFREDYLNALSGYELANDDAMSRAKLLLGFSDLGILIDPSEKPPFDEKTAYVRDFQHYFEKIIGSLKKAMNAPSSVAEPEFKGAISWKELKSLWTDTAPSADIMLNFVRMQDPKAKLAGYEPKGSTRTFQEASEKTSKFGEVLKKFLDANTAYDILAYRFFEGLDTKVTKPQERASKALGALKTKYAK